MTATGGDTVVSLAGDWLFRAGAELEDYPGTLGQSLIAAVPVPSMPSELFNGLINPLTQFRIKGVIWYQGEANAIKNQAELYSRLFPALIEDWRRHWAYQVPFLFVQLAGAGRPASERWGELREAQTEALSLPLTGMATAIDIGEANIHPKNKTDVAHRLALAATAIVYGEHTAHAGPTYQSVRFERNAARIHFANVGSGLTVKDPYGYVRGFEIAGLDGKFYWAQALTEGEDVVVSSSRVEHPVAVRYDWQNLPDGDLYNREGLPATPFRTNAPAH